MNEIGDGHAASLQPPARSPIHEVASWGMKELLNMAVLGTEVKVAQAG